GLIADSEHSLNLIGTHALARFTEQIGSYKPFEQRQMGIVKDRSRCDAELVITLFAVIQLLRSSKRNNSTFASWTLNTTRPAQTFQKFAALFIAGKHLMNINQSH